MYSIIPILQQISGGESEASFWKLCSGSVHWESDASQHSFSAGQSKGRKEAKAADDEWSRTFGKALQPQNTVEVA
jgi:hypothetical protein